MNPLNWNGRVIRILACGVASSALQAAEVTSLDPVIDWTNPVGMLQAEFESKLPQALDESARSPIRNGLLLQVVGTDDPEPYGILKGRLRISSFVAGTEAERIAWLAVVLQSDEKTVLGALQEVYSAAPGKHVGRDSQGNKVETLGWDFAGFIVRVRSRNPGEVTVNLVATRRSGGGSSSIASAAQGGGPRVDADLDYLLSTAELWQCDTKTFEQRYVAKTEGEQAKPPQFEWLTANKDRARFSRKMYADVETRLTMFGGSIRVEEAVVEFIGGRAARATISFYNRGDSGEISIKDFETIYKKIGQNMGQVFKVSPKSQLISSNAAVKTVGWIWTTPASIALMEYNELGGSLKPEFLRLKLAAPNQADWSMGRLAVGVQRMALAKNITRSPAGDVYIAGVPMVDQGAKGYCVAASCQRLFEYMQIPCDQHEMAQLLNVDVERGANAFEMQKSLAKVDGRFKVTFKPLVNPELYYDNKGKRRVSLKEFSGIVKENADKGVPLLWALQLGLFKEDPPLPGGGQISGGHMRVIIGYNPKTNQILFTDSWGAGHELKRMDASDAYQATLGLYSMAPRGL